MTYMRVGRAMGERELLFIELVDKLLAVSSDDGNGRHGNLGDKGTRDECFYILWERQHPPGLT